VLYTSPTCTLMFAVKVVPREGAQLPGSYGALALLVRPQVQAALQDAVSSAGLQVR